MNTFPQGTLVGVVSIDRLLPSKYQMRHEAFEEEREIRALAASISSIGMIESPLVRADPDHLGYYEIISGHRRIRAVSEILRWKEVQCVIYKNLDELTALKLAMTDNIHRSDLSEYEEGMAFLLCQRNFGFPDSKIAKFLNKPRATVTSKKTFAIRANKYKRYLEETDFEKFLRNVKHQHLDLLENISNESIIQRAVAVVKSSPDINDLKSFLATSDVQDYEKAETNSEMRRRSRSEKDQLLTRLVSEISRLRENAPDEVRPQIYLLQDIAENIRSRYHLHTPLAEEVREYHVVDVREFRCPSCGEELQIEKRVDDEAKTIAFVLGLKNSDSVDDDDDDDDVKLAFSSAIRDG